MFALIVYWEVFDLCISLSIVAFGRKVYLFCTVWRLAVSFRPHKPNQHKWTQHADMNIAKKNQVSRQTSSDPATELPSISSQSSHLNIRFDEVEMLTNAGMWMLDLHNMLFHASERTNKLLGTNAPHNTIEYYLQNVHPEDRKRIHASYQASTLPKQNYVSETFRVHISGQETILKSRIKLDLDNEGKISRTFAA